MPETYLSLTISRHLSILSLVPSMQHSLSLPSPNLTSKRLPKNKSFFLEIYFWSFLLLGFFFFNFSPTVSLRMMLTQQSSFNFLIKVPLCPINLPAYKILSGGKIKGKRTHIKNCQVYIREFHCVSNNVGRTSFLQNPLFKTKKIIWYVKVVSKQLSLFIVNVTASARFVA